MKLVTTKFKLGGLHEKNVVATRNLGNHLSICFWAQGNQEKPVLRWPVAGHPNGLFVSVQQQETGRKIHEKKSFIIF